MERIAIAGAESSEGETADREQKVGKEKGCSLIPGDQTVEEKSKSEFPSLLSMTLGKS